MTRIERGRIVREAVLAIAHTHGRWEEFQANAVEGGITRSWTIDSGQGWWASMDTPFTSPSFTPSHSDLYMTALGKLELPKEFQQSIDVYWNGFGKVLSIGQIDGEDTLVGFTPGPWEAAFGLPNRSWPPAVARRLERRTARDVVRPSLWERDPVGEAKLRPPAPEIDLFNCDLSNGRAVFRDDRI